MTTLTARPAREAPPPKRRSGTSAGRTEGNEMTRRTQIDARKFVALVLGATLLAPIANASAERAFAAWLGVGAVPERSRWRTAPRSACGAGVAIPWSAANPNSRLICVVRATAIASICRATLRAATASSPECGVKRAGASAVVFRARNRAGRSLRLSRRRHSQRRLPSRPAEIVSPFLSGAKAISAT